MANNSLIEKIVNYWDLSEEQLQEINVPTRKIYKNEAFQRFYENAEKLMICGDYDCDGVSSVSIAAILAKKMNIDYGYYIPNRIKEGYGLSVETVNLAQDRGYKDLLLVDNGVKSHDAIQLALDFGMNVAVVDHHLIDEPLPDEVLLIHPDLIEDSYFDTMSAGGLMMSLAEGMNLLDPYIVALGALSTVADVMPLWGKNREIVRRGVKILNENRFPQFDYLVKRNNYTVYTAELLAFQVSPKINSIGRMGDIANINTAVEYFLSEEFQTIKSYSTQVMRINTQRKALGKQLQEQAMKKINGEKIQIISDPSYHEGLLGIIANHIAQDTGKPSIILKEYEDVYKGSARSNNVSLQELFNQLDPDYFLAMGGHDFAYGMTIPKSKFEDFKNDLYKLMNDYDLSNDNFEGLDVFDFEFSHDIIKTLKRFEPLGQGIKLPLMRIKMPDDYDVVRLNGHGYKILFKNTNINEALYFTQENKENEIKLSNYLIFRLNMQSKRKLEVYVEELIEPVL